MDALSSSMGSVAHTAQVGSASPTWRLLAILEAEVPSHSAAPVTLEDSSSDPPWSTAAAPRDGIRTVSAHENDELARWMSDEGAGRWKPSLPRWATAPWRNHDIAVACIMNWHCP